MSETPEVLVRFFSAWSKRDPALALAEVTPDVVITDPFGSNVGSEVLREHLEMILRRFDFAPARISNCFVDGELDGDCRIAFVAECPMTGRSSSVAGVETGFEAAVFVTLKGGRIHRWNEYWDPAPMTAKLAGATA